MPTNSDISSASSDSLLKRKRKNYSKSHEYLINKLKNIDLQTPSSQESLNSEPSTLAHSEDRSTSNLSVETKNQGSISDFGESEHHVNTSENKTPAIDVETIGHYDLFSQEQKNTLSSEDKGRLLLQEKQSRNESQSARSRPSCCVFVASLFLELSDEVLLNSVKNHFSKYGEIKLAKVLRDSSNRPYAFVQYFNVQDANRALKESAGRLLNNRPIRVEMAKVNRTLLVRERNKLKENLSDLFLCRNFRQIGELEQVVRLGGYLELIEKKKVPELSNTQRQLIFNNMQHLSNDDIDIAAKCWFVQFAFREDAISAHAFCQNNTRYKVEWTANIDLLGSDEYNIVSEFNSAKEKDIIQLLGGEKFSKFNFYNSNTDDMPVRREKEASFGKIDSLHLEKQSQAIDVYSVFVGQLTTQCTKKNLFDRFIKHGIIENIKLFNRNPKNCYAFITFQNKKATASAVEVENHSSMNKKSIHVQYRETRHINAEKKKQFNSNPSNLHIQDFESKAENENLFLTDSNKQGTNTDSNIDTLTPTNTVLPQKAFPYSSYGYNHHLITADNSPSPLTHSSLQAQYEYLYGPLNKLTGGSYIQQTYGKTYIPTQTYNGFGNNTTANAVPQEQYQNNGYAGNISQISDYYTLVNKKVHIQTINQLNKYEEPMAKPITLTDQSDLVTCTKNLEKEMHGPMFQKSSHEKRDELRNMYLNNSL